MPDAVDRLIPTYMGNSRGSSVPPTPTAVNPHVHGELGSTPYPEVWIVG